MTFSLISECILNKLVSKYKIPNLTKARQCAHMPAVPAAHTYPAHTQPPAVSHKVYNKCTKSYGDGPAHCPLKTHH